MMATRAVPDLEIAPQTEGRCIATAARDVPPRNPVLTIRHSKPTEIPFATLCREIRREVQKPYSTRPLDLAVAVIPETIAVEVAEEAEAGEMIAETAEGIAISILGTEEITIEMNVAENVIVEIGEIAIGIASEEDDHRREGDRLRAGISEIQET